MHHTNSDEIARMVKWQTVKLEDQGANSVASEFSCAMLQRVSSDRVYIIVFSVNFVCKEELNLMLKVSDF